MADEGAVLNSSVQMLEMGGKAIYYTGKEAVHIIMAIYKLMETLRLAQWHGKADMKTLMDIKGDNLAFIEVSSEDRKVLKEIEKDMKKEGILFSRLPDLNVKDGKTQFAFSAEDAALMKVYLSKYAEKVKTGKASAEIRIISAAEYARSGYEDDWTKRPELKELEDLAKKEMSNEKDPDKRRGRRPRERRQSRKGGWDREGAKTITINKKMYEDEEIYKKPGYFISRIPRTHMYCEIPEADMRRLNENTVIAYIYPDREYTVATKDGDVVDKNGRPLEKIKGTALVEKSYDDKTRRKEVIKDDPQTAIQEMEKLHKVATTDCVVKEISNKNIIAVSENGSVICQVPELDGKALVIPPSAVMNYQRDGGVRAFFESSSQYYVVDKLNLDKVAGLDGRQMAGLFEMKDPVTRAKTLENISKAVKERGVDLRKALGGDGMTLQDFLSENAPKLTGKGGKKL